MTVREFLDAQVYRREALDRWFARQTEYFGVHDGAFGWLLRDARIQDGIDGAICTYTYAPSGERISIHYAESPCRIHTYGDSMTQCHQVSDGETWQERLAAHLGEPIKNYGVGGWSVYQAYLRMLKQEAVDPGPYLIFNIYIDDHFRNLDAWLRPRLKTHRDFIGATKPYLRVNLESGAVTEHPNPCPTRESFYRLCDKDWVYETFNDDFVMQLLVAHLNAKARNPDTQYQALLEQATTHGVNTSVSEGATLDVEAAARHERAAYRSTMWLVEQIERFARREGKQVLYVLSYSSLHIGRRIREGKRDDQVFVDYLKEKKLPYVDLMEAHLQDFAAFRISEEEYLKRYFMGHYNPLGNFFTAFAIKPQLLDFLNPKPSAYQSQKSRA